MHRPCRKALDTRIPVMGREARCTIEHGGQTFTGRVLLETTELLIRGDAVKASIPFAGLTAIDAKDGWLELRAGRARTRLELGKDAERWADRIKNPPSLLKKLGIAEGTAVCLVVGIPPALRAEIEGGGARIVRGRGQADVILLAVASAADLDTLHDLRAEMRDEAAVWATWAKGRRELTETHVRAAALEAGLVDVKVASVSDVLSGLKLVIRRADRAGSKK